jgi:hypothetical protein
VIAETICGRKFEVEKTPQSPEELCLRCDKDKCMTYQLYLYAVTHNNNP